MGGSAVGHVSCLYIAAVHCMLHSVFPSVLLIATHPFQLSQYGTHTYPSQQCAYGVLTQLCTQYFACPAVATNALLLLHTFHAALCCRMYVSQRSDVLPSASAVHCTIFLAAHNCMLQHVALLLLQLYPPSRQVLCLIAGQPMTAPGHPPL